jgi:glycerol kinase
MTDIVRLRNRVIAFISILNLVVPTGLRAADATGETTTAPHPAPLKPHHKHKKKTASSAAGNASAAAAGTKASDSGKAAAKNTEGTGISDGLGSNSPGSPNMGSPDHTPGSTGTSGQ